MKEKLSKYGLPLVLIFLTLFVYRKLPEAFFEQDEWHSFGHYIYLNSLSSKEFWGTALRSGTLTHFTPLSLFFKMSLYSLFGLVASKYFVVSITLHSLVVISLYTFIHLLSKNRLASFLGALFFAINFSHNQAVTWLGTFEGVELATLFGLLSLILYLKYQKNKNSIYNISSYFLLLVSLLFKEIALVFLGARFVIGCIYEKRKGVRNTILSLVSVVFIYIAFRFSYLFFGVESLPSAVGITSSSYLKTLIYNSLTLPFKFISLSIFPYELLQVFAKNIVTILPSTLSISNGVWFGLSDLVFDFIASGVGFVFAVYFLINVLKKKSTLGTIGLAIIVFSVVPMLILRKYIVYPDSRFFYTASLGIGLLMADMLVNAKKKYLLILAILVFVLNWKFLNLRINTLVDNGMTRKDILESINSKIPELDGNTVVYADSDEQLYGLKDYILPFQSGLGQILLVQYAQKQNISPKFFTNEFLWDITSEGYMKVNDQGFGYYLNRENLIESLRAGDFEIHDVRGISYERGRIVDITERIKGEILSHDLSKKKVLLKPSNISSELNFQDSQKIVDQDRESFWDSGITYNIPQDISIELGKLVVVSEIVIDSYTDINQDKVGYSVYASMNGSEWEEIFTDVLLPPSKDGKVRILFSPTEAKFIKIKQIGSHKYANWVIHELEVYEKIN